MLLVRHVISENHVIKALFYFMVWSSSRQVTIFPSLMAIGTVVMEL